MRSAFDASSLEIDPAEVSDRIIDGIRRTTVETLQKRGIVVGVSGGVDSAVVLALSVRAFGPDRVLALAMPERESSALSLELAQELCDELGVNLIVEDITDALEAIGCYARRDGAIRSLFPAYTHGWKAKLAISDAGYQLTEVVVEDPYGQVSRARPTAEAYRTIVAASNFKQRTRKMIEYYHADRLGYAVAGTPNRLEYELGFFVKGGDGQADLKPIAQLYKTQVYQLAHHLGVPESICGRPPTTDTFPMAQSQEEFYFTLPYLQMDICLHALEQHKSTEETAALLDLPPARVASVFRNIERKRTVTRPLHLSALLIE